MAHRKILLPVITTMIYWKSDLKLWIPLGSIISAEIRERLFKSIENLTKTFQTQISLILAFLKSCILSNTITNKLNTV